MYMGRHRKYNTEDELKMARRKAAMKYYEKNRKSIQEKNLQRYYAKIGRLQNN